MELVIVAGNTELVIVAGNLIPRIQEAIESSVVKGLENLAFWIAVAVAF